MFQSKVSIISWSAGFSPQPTPLGPHRSGFPAALVRKTTERQRKLTESTRKARDKSGKYAGNTQEKAKDDEPAGLGSCSVRYLYRSCASPMPQCFSRTLMKIRSKSSKNRSKNAIEKLGITYEVNDESAPGFQRQALPPTGRVARSCTRAAGTGQTHLRRRMNEG